MASDQVREVIRKTSSQSSCARPRSSPFVWFLLAIGPHLGLWIERVGLQYRPQRPFFGLSKTVIAIALHQLGAPGRKKVRVVVQSQPRALAIADVGQILFYVVVTSCGHGAGVGVTDLEYGRNADNATSQVAIGQHPVVKLGLLLRAAVFGYQGKR